MFDPEDLQAIRDAQPEWEASTLDPTLAAYGEREEEFRTDVGGQSIDRLYTPADIADLDYLADLGFPGDPPYTRGVYPTMYRGRLWTMRQYAGMGTADETNERFRYLLSEGQTGLSLAFDLPTQMGHDSDASLAAGEVGKAGVAIDTIADLERVFADIPLDEISTSMTINAPAPILLAMYVALADRRGVDRRELRGTIQNDVLKEYIARNTFIFPPEESMNLVTDVFEFCADETPSVKAISISGYHIREAGATATQELAFTLANGIEYVEAAQNGGLSVDSFGPQLSFFFAAHNDIFEEVAKFRAARRLWHRIVTERFGATDPEASKLKFHVQTAGSTLAPTQVDNNVVRVAYQALAAILGGAQSLHTNSKDEALSLPSEDAVRTALRTQQILAHESGVTNTVDPLGGSYYVESLTEDLVRDARELIDQIDERGGMQAAIDSGWVQRQIRDVDYRRQQAIEDGDEVVVGVNAFADEAETDPDPDTATSRDTNQDRQVAHLDSVKESRDDAAVEDALNGLQNALQNDHNVMPPLIDAVDAYATVGEICDLMREELGEYN